MLRKAIRRIRSAVLFAMALALAVGLLAFPAPTAALVMCYVLWRARQIDHELDHALHLLMRHEHSTAHAATPDRARRQARASWQRSATLGLPASNSLGFANVEWAAAHSAAQTPGNRCLFVDAAINADRQDLAF
jgi:hypothetical protein